MPAKEPATKQLLADGAKLGEAVPRAVVDRNTASVGIPPLPEVDTEAELGTIRKQLETLRQQVADASAAVKGGARHAVRQTEATVKLYPVSSFMTVATIAAVFAFAAIRLQAPRRSRYDRALDDLRDLYDSLRAGL